jgi:rsbT co-antagonist protein RsbR
MPEHSSLHQELAATLSEKQHEILQLWIRQLLSGSQRIVRTLGEETIKKTASDLLIDFLKALPAGDDAQGTAYESVRRTLERLSAECALRDVSPTETAMFIFSMKEAYLQTLQNAYGDREKLSAMVIALNRLLDQLGLFTFDVYGKKRESVIKEQQRALMELSVPIVKVWDGILLVPLIGVLDSARTQMVMETLLTAIEDTQSKVAILDISGIPVVDTLVAKHLIRTVSAAKLMGAECIITGIRSRISQTIIQLGVDLSGVVTRSTLADGLRIALDITGQKIAIR